MLGKLHVLLVATILCISMLASSADAYQIGISPSVVNAGEMERGATKVLHFFVTTQSKDDIIVSISKAQASLDYFKKPSYKQEIQEYSEQDATSWVEFINNPITLKYDPTEKKNGNINKWRKVNLILKIPEDAEPGYHAISIRPTPQLPQGYGTTFNIVSLTSTMLLVKVPGEAVRSGKILDVKNNGYLGNRLRLSTVFQNTGTVTMTARANNVNIYDQDGEVLYNIKSPFVKIKPGDVVDLEALFQHDLEPGDYQVSSSVNFGTDKENKEIEVYIGQPTVKLEEPAPTIQLPGFSFEWLLIPLIIIIAYLIYRRGSD